MSGRISTAVRGLTPGYFALVMASGIISVGMELGGFRLLSIFLLAVCVVSYAVLILLTVWRLIAYPQEMWNDLTAPRRAFGFFTFIAGTNVLGVRIALSGHHMTTAVLLIVAVVTWLALGYVIPWTAVLSRVDRPVVAHANGSWFIWVVASQSIAVASATIEPTMPSIQNALAIVAVCAWSVGVFLYAAAGIFVAARMMWFEFRPVDLDPPYWVAMGACAITILAGARIVEMADAPMVSATRGIIEGAAVVFWGFATWLIPVLTAAGLWRHIIHRIPLRYEATLWSIVFPLGMYSVGATYLGQADKLPIVEAIGNGWLWVAFIAWALTFMAMLSHLVRTVVFDAPNSAAAR